VKVKEAEAGMLQKLVGYTLSKKICPLHASFERPTLETLCLQLEHAATRSIHEAVWSKQPGSPRGWSAEQNNCSVANLQKNIILH